MVAASQWVVLCRSCSLELAGDAASAALLAWSAGFVIGRCWRWLPPLVVDVVAVPGPAEPVGCQLEFHPLI